MGAGLLQLRLPEEVRNRLTDEISFAADRMSEEGVGLRKLYFFSAVFGVVGRELNHHWDPKLALIYQVTNLSYQQINSRLQQIAAGDTTLPVGRDILGALDVATQQLARLLKQEEILDPDLLRILGSMAELSYATTGNGHYLLTRGRIRLKRLQ